MEKKFTSVLLFIFVAAIASGLFALHTYLKNQNANSAGIPPETTIAKTVADKTLEDLGTTLKETKPLRETAAVASDAEGKTPVDAKADQKKIATLREILKSKNDNDPRLDTDFKSLSTGAKTLMRVEYKGMKAESFNEKGTVVFLLGRNLTTSEDFDFLNGVLTEPPCRSMSDCSTPAEPATGEAAHLDSINQTTLAYPQIVSLKAAENYLTGSSAPDSLLKQSAIKTLTVASGSQIGQVAQEARQFLRQYNGLNN